MIKVTAKNISRQGRGRVFGTGTAPQWVAFGPEGHTPEAGFRGAEEKLYSEGLPEGAKARSLVGSLVGGAIRFAGDAVRSAFTYPREGAAYGRTGSYFQAGEQAREGAYPAHVEGVLGAIKGGYPVLPAVQAELRKWTRIRGPVYGAAFVNGEREGELHVAEEVERGAAQYIRHITGGLAETAKRYAGHLVEYVKTIGHEKGHLGGIEGEEAAERAGERYLAELAYHPTIGPIISKAARQHEHGGYQPVALAA